MKYVERKRFIRTPFELEDSKIIILGIPFVSKHYGELKDSRDAPKEIRKYFDYFYEYDLDSKKSIYSIPFYDAGDVIVTKNFDEAKRRVTHVLEEIRVEKPDSSFIFLGGDHLITPMVMEVLRPKSALILDAHLDLLERADDYPHATAIRKVFSICKNLTIQGIRDVDKEEIKFARKEKIKFSKKLNFKGRIDYLSIDVDVMNYSYVSTSSPVLTETTPFDVLRIIRNSRFRFADIVEWSPPYGFPTVVKILRELIFQMS